MRARYTGQGASALRARNIGFLMTAGSWHLTSPGAAAWSKDDLEGPQESWTSLLHERLPGAGAAAHILFGASSKGLRPLLPGQHARGADAVGAPRRWQRTMPAAPPCASHARSLSARCGCQATAASGGCRLPSHALASQSSQLHSRASSVVLHSTHCVAWQADHASSNPTNTHTHRARDVLLGHVVGWCLARRNLPSRTQFAIAHRSLPCRACCDRSSLPPPRP